MLVLYRHPIYPQQTCSLVAVPLFPLIDLNVPTEEKIQCLFDGQIKVNHIAHQNIFEMTGQLVLDPAL